MLWISKVCRIFSKDFCWKTSLVRRNSLKKNLCQIYWILCDGLHTTYLRGKIISRMGKCCKFRIVSLFTLESIVAPRDVFAKWISNRQNCMCRVSKRMGECVYCARKKTLFLCCLFFCNGCLLRKMQLGQNNIILAYAYSANFYLCL